jgi:sterol desaturase/sphingolipid hydroxylase (fatty acid hydroxylase superfamily)
LVGEQSIGVLEPLRQLIDRLAAELARHAFLSELVRSTLIGLGVYAVCAVVILLAERSQRRKLAAYRTPNALNDLAYVIFYQCSIYNLLVSPLFAGIAPRLQFLRVGLLVNLPPLVSLALCWLIFDFLNYWMHRLQHGMQPFWAFHSVHHTQTQLTFLTANRIHIFEQLYVGVLMIVPAFLLGIPQPRWLPLLLLQVFIETISHARLSWTFGPLHGVLVSPAFHALHHSADPREYNGNYARILSIWDRLFGTFVRSAPPTRFGVDGMDVPETLTAQFAHPFRLLAGSENRLR